MHHNPLYAIDVLGLSARQVKAHRTGAAATLGWKADMCSYTLLALNKADIVAGARRKGVLSWATLWRQTHTAPNQMEESMGSHKRQDGAEERQQKMGSSIGTYGGFGGYVAGPWLETPYSQTSGNHSEETNFTSMWPAALMLQPCAASS